MSWSWNKVNTLRKTHWKIGFDSMKRLHKLCANTWRKGILKSRCCHLLSCQIFWVLKFVQLVQCLAETSDLSMSSYIAGYQEVFKFLTLLGSGGWSFIKIHQSRRFQVPTFKWKTLRVYNIFVHHSLALNYVVLRSWNPERKSESVGYLPPVDTGTCI